MKKVLSTLLAVAMVATMLVGCGSNASTEAAADATGAETFKIGGIGPVTGGAAVYGIAVKNGAQIAVDEINAAGGINGYQIEYNFQDDECDAEKSVNAYNTLKDWDMDILMGTVTSGCCVAVAAKTVEDNMFELTPSGSSVDIVTGNDNVFQVCFTDPNQGIASAQYIAGKGLATKIGIIYDSSDVYSTGIYEKFVSEAANQGLEVVATEAFTADNKTDFTTQLQKIKDAGAELVFLPFYYTEATLVLKQADTMGFAPIFFGCDGLDGILAVENFDVALAEDVMLLTPFAADATDEKTANFVKKYNELYGETPNQFAADAYDAMYIIKAALEAKSATPAMSVSELGDACKAAMVEIKVDGITGEAMTWNAGGEVNKAPKAVVIKDGAYKAVD